MSTQELLYKKFIHAEEKDDSLLAELAKTALLAYKAGWMEHAKGIPLDDKIYSKKLLG